jgi:hypothetical protein
LCGLQFLFARKCHSSQAPQKVQPLLSTSSHIRLFNIITENSARATKQLEKYREKYYKKKNRAKEANRWLCHFKMTITCSSNRATAHTTAIN